MLWTSLKILPKKSLGIDIGTSSIKIIELSSFRGREKLENYGEIAASVLYEKPFRTFEKNTLLLSSRDIARALKAVMEEAKMKTRQAIFSIPDFSSFFTNFELPSMTKEEISQAVIYEARRHIPLPLAEVTIDWEIIEGQLSNHEGSSLKVLLVAVPNEVINQYREIAQIANLELLALEAEVFGLVRSLILNDDKRTVSLIDIGAQSTTCSIIEKRGLKKSHSFDTSGNELTEQVAKSLSINYKTAKELKEKYGLRDVPLPRTTAAIPSETKTIREILLPLVDIILREIENITRNLYQTEGKEVQKYIIAGGTALIPGLKEYFQSYLKKEVEIANPFYKIFYTPILEEEIKKMGPAYAIAVGMAQRGLEQ
ncbi:MAG: hypothetical protein COV64_02345 [Candidatus Nealsonbacteria bacterium CG11_big_fil_rev_8_21_14_0_20_39_9]|uniref:SHS2 domain-containing protein n=1 Tax=Candidatus Nealsonbacteria bacterium CG11_big_fil_rev_8_21_14_0_20_39_9 TaxID=1974715 RepID=A0A2H0MNP6_9BACT|nr:MAG: hypothetical protein COV64_02345 [Candidatus Nealsonbacteria bacterium CG11_big_fil_rev_8_21_14_0_20_39_9]